MADKPDASSVLDGARQAALRDLGLLDTGPEEVFDRFTRLATQLLDVPVSLVSLVEGDRQFFKSQVGLPEPWAQAAQTPLSHSFCQYAVASKEPLVIEDARLSPLVADNLAVRDLDVVAYAGMPLVLDDGHAVGALCAIDGKPRKWTARELGILEDLAAAVKTLLDLRGALARQSLHDRLTGLPNRELVVALCQQALEAPSSQGAVAVLAAGLDGFSLINEAYGARQADCVLREVGDRLGRLLRGGDMLGRLQGDVFTILCPGVGNEQEAMAIAGRIREALRSEPLHVGEDTLVASATLGVSIGVPGSDAGDLIGQAAEAMRRAKTRAGRVLVAERGYGELAAARLRLRGALGGAVARGDIGVAYQSIVDLETGVAHGFEALARWTDPELGVVSPADFIPVAEASGDVIHIGEHVLRTACRQVAVWRAQTGEDLHVSVNLAPLQLEQANLVDVVRDVLEESGLPGTALMLEITEGALLEAGTLQQGILEGLRELGALVALDDFGTGYSALGYLKRFPIDVVKIDRSFVTGMEDDRRDQALVKAIVTMAAGLDAPVVAEGIETPAQAELLRSLGCRWAQGFLFARPLPADQVALPGTSR